MSAQVKPHKFDMEIDFMFNEILLVECQSTRRFPATRSTPAEGGTEVLSVYWRGQQISHLLDKSELDKITDLVNAT